MSAKAGWAVAVVAVALGWWFWRWLGAGLAIAGTVFWMLWQFTQALRAMRDAGTAPVGSVHSAAMLHAQLQKGMRLLDVIRITRSLGQKLSDDPETFAWHDESGAMVTMHLQDGRVTDWTLTRTDAA
jgi:hypothetical protein